MIKKANIQHAAEIGQLFAAATAAMQARGLDQWNENYPLEAHARIDLESDCVYAYFVVSPTEFYIAAGLVGMVMGGIQALSRSTYAKLMPETQDTTSFFSFYDVAEKIGIVLGTFIYGALGQGSGDLRNGIIMFGVFFC